MTVAVSREDWKSQLRARPSQAQLQSHLAWCRASGEDPAASCEQRWGSGPADLMRRAPELREPKGRRRTKPIQA